MEQMCHRAFLYETLRKKILFLNLLWKILSGSKVFTAAWLLRDQRKSRGL